MLERIVLAAMGSETIDRVVVATTDRSEDDVLVRWADGFGLHVVRGSEADVLSRFAMVLEEFDDTETLVRITGDCPFLDPRIIDQLVRLHKTLGPGFTANRLPPPAKRSYPIGLDVEVVDSQSLVAAHERATQRHEREHVLPFIYERPDEFRVTLLDLDENLGDMRWTVDTDTDLALARRLIELVGDDPVPWQVVLEAVRANPGLSDLNSNVPQRGVTHFES